MIKTKWLRSFGLLMMLTITLPAQALDAPTGKVVLTISGKISNTNSPAGADFDMAMLEKLAQHDTTTRTPWYAQPVKFTGPLLRDVLAAAGAQGSQITAVALNDYKTDIPMADSVKYDMLIARLLDDKPMPVREKGPLFIIYPFDSKNELRTELYHGRSAWQLRSLQIK